VILDVGNGLGAQDPVIAEVLRPRRLVAVNITEWQLSAGRDRLREAGALPVAGDATRLPVADQSIDGVISVEAAFHFRSRRAFFNECFRGHCCIKRLRDHEAVNLPADVHLCSRHTGTKGARPRVWLSRSGRGREIFLSNDHAIA
jgi:hypothetical protein